MRAGALRRAASSLLTLTCARGFHVRISHLYVCQDQIDRARVRWAKSVDREWEGGSSLPRQADHRGGREKV